MLAGGAACVAVLACGDGAAGVRSAPAARAIVLTLRFDDGAGKVSPGTLTCRAGEQRATGIARPAAKSCTRIRRIATFLLTKPRKDRVCTLQFGGPQTVRVRGRIDGKAINRRYNRTNGCEISDYDRLAGALPAVAVAGK